jgi:hypothetical protein
MAIGMAALIATDPDETDRRVQFPQFILLLLRDTQGPRGSSRFALWRRPNWINLTAITR